LVLRLRFVSRTPTGGLAATPLALLFGDFVVGCGAVDDNRRSRALLLLSVEIFLQ